MRVLQFESRLAARAGQVWAEVSTLRGVNAELMPLMRMTYPLRAEALAFSTAPTGEVLFHSWLLLFGLLPVDRHALSIERLYPGEGFDERSSSWTQRVWIHRRRVQPVAGGCRVRDELSFEPRLPLAAPLLRAIVSLLFRHRHRRLRARFGQRSAK